MPCGDVPGRVHIGVQLEVAGGAAEDGLALARLPVHHPARRAPLARERGINSFDPARGFSHQSLRRSVSRTVSLASAVLALLRRPEPRSALASLRSSFLIRRCSPGVRPGTVSISPVDKAADTVTPRSIPITAPLPGVSTGSGATANATCQRPARSRVTRNAFTPSGMRRDQRNRTQPTFGMRTCPQWRPTRRTSPDKPCVLRPGLG